MRKKFQRTTRRLVIRPLRSSDYLSWKKAYQSVLPVKNKFDQHHRTPSELTQQKFQKILSRRRIAKKEEEFFYYGIFDRKTGAYMGSLTLGHLIRSLTQSTILGYSLLNNYWGYGYASEAILAVLDIAFRDHKLHRVVAGIEPDNKRSLKLIKKLKFRREGLSKGIVYLRGDWRDLVQYSINSEDFGIICKPF